MLFRNLDFFLFLQIIDFFAYFTNQTLYNINKLYINKSYI